MDRCSANQNPQPRFLVRLGGGVFAVYWTISLVVTAALLGITLGFQVDRSGDLALALLLLGIIIGTIAGIISYRKNIRYQPWYIKAGLILAPSTPYMFGIAYWAGLGAQIGVIYLIASIVIFGMVYILIERKKIQAMPGFATVSWPDVGHQLTSRIIGQDEAISKIISVLVANKEVRAESSRPRGVFMLVGPSGVGKTEFALEMSRLTGLPLKRFDMGSYKTPHDQWDLIGSPRGHYDHGRGGALTRAVAAHPRGGILLIDEIEKSHRELQDTFLNAFDAGYFTDRRSDERPANTQQQPSPQGQPEPQESAAGRVYLTKWVVIITSNLCQNMDFSLGENELKEELVRNGLRREWLGRVDCIVPFQRLSRDVASEVLWQKVNQGFERLINRKKEGLPVRRTQTGLPVPRQTGINWRVEHKEELAEILIDRANFNSEGVRSIQKVVDRDIFGQLISLDKDHTTSEVVLTPYPSQDEEKGIKYLVFQKPQPDYNAFRDIGRKLKSKIKAQDNALDDIVSTIQSHAVASINPDRPLAAMLFLGPTGVGKTETAKMLAEALSRKLIRFDMGNFKGPMEAEQFYGSSAHQTPGKLTRAVIEAPSAVILLDEVEKACPTIWDTFLSVFDAGQLQDGYTGERVSFARTIIIMTSNLLEGTCEVIEQAEARERLMETGYFRDEFLNRIDRIVVFQPLPIEVLKGLVGNTLRLALNNTYQKDRIKVTYEPSVVAYLATRKIARRYGARDIERIIRAEIGAALFPVMSNGKKAPGAVRLFVESDKLKVEGGADPGSTLKIITLNTDHPFEKTVASFLRKQLASESGTLISGCHISNGKERCDIDHILVLDRGIIVLEDKCYKGRIEGSSNTEWMVDGVTTINASGRLNPRQQLRDYCYALKDYLAGKLGIAPPIYGIVAFPIDTELALGDIPVGYMDGMISAGQLSDIPGMVRQVKSRERIAVDEISNVLQYG